MATALREAAYSRRLDECSVKGSRSFVRICGTDGNPSTLALMTSRSATSIAADFRR
jgi:hypothetical protein